MNEQERNEVMEVVTNEPKPKRGSKSASVVANCTANSEEISQIIGESYQFFKMDIVKSDEECADRLNWYFSLCQERGQIPTVEDMCLALGTVRRTVWGWEQGELGNSRANMIKKAKEILAGIDAKLVSQGKIPQITYIFRAKNFFGMVDKQEHILTPNQKQDTDYNAEDIRSRYLIEGGNDDE
jgi:hypothetical protein